MGKTYKRNGRWKKDRKDQGFRQSKKFKQLQGGNNHSPHQKPQLDESSELENGY